VPAIDTNFVMENIRLWERLSSRDMLFGNYRGWKTAPTEGRHSALFIKKNFEFHRRSGAGGSDNFSGYHDRFLGFGKLKGHGYLLSDGQWFCGFNKNSGTTNVLNK
jgi:hypothetical protein